MSKPLRSFAPLTTRWPNSRVPHLPHRLPFATAEDQGLK
jgi:hypothetical protein